MNKMGKITYKVDYEILKNYVDTINSIKEPMCEIKKYLSQESDSIKDNFKNISVMYNIKNDMQKKYSNDQVNVIIDIIKQIMNVNNGMISTRMIESLNISRQYLSIMEKNNDIEKISRGIYLSPSVFEDSYFSFQQKYKKAIFSHMNALYFYGMTEEFPYNYTVTVPQNYHVDSVNEKCNVFYVSDDIYELGVVEVETPNGNKVRAYDKERCICDIIRSKGRMDMEQVRKSINQYIYSKDKDLVKLSEYSKKMGINKKVMGIVGRTYYE